MRDQAAELRDLVKRQASAATQQSTRGPVVLALAAGRSGVGVTSLAVNLASALSIHGRRVVLVDAHRSTTGVAGQCDLHGAYHLGDVISGRRNIHEVLERGPAGIQIIAGVPHGNPTTEYSPQVADRLVADLRQLGAHSDCVLLDIGTDLHRGARRLWRLADRVLIVSTPEPLAVMDTYAVIKSFVTSETPCPPQLLINGVEDVDAAEKCHQRLERASRQFLQMDLELAGHVPADPAVIEAARKHRPFVLEFPQSAAARAIEPVAEALMQVKESAPRRTDILAWPVSDTASDTAAELRRLQNTA